MPRAHFEKRFKWALQAEPCPQYEDYAIPRAFNSDALEVLERSNPPSDYLVCSSVMHALNARQTCDNWRTDLIAG